MDIAIVDLGLGNLHSVEHALRRAGGDPQVVSAPEEIRRASRLVVPGQGGFGEGAERLHDGVGEVLRERLEAGAPYFGICLGMQLLFESSEEAPGAAGLGVLAGSVKHFEPSSSLPVPHMGWNEVQGPSPCRGWFYFAHSYFCSPRDASVVLATAEYGQAFCAAIRSGPMVACQFHPEKSQLRGARLLEAFVKGAEPWS